MFDKELVPGSPTSESAALLLGLDVSALTAEQAFEVVLACERLSRAASAVQQEAMVVAAGPAPEPDPDTGRESLDSNAEWLAVALGGSRQFQLNRIDEARYLRRWLPRTCAAMRAGEWGGYEAGLMVRAAQSLTRPELIGRLEERILPRGTADLARRLRRAVARLDPAAVEQKQRRARSQRSLQFFQDRYGDGSAGLAGRAPSHLTALIAAAIDLDARPRLDGDCRTIDMRRFDVLADWARQRLGLPTENHRPDQAGSLDAEAATAAAGALLTYARHTPSSRPADSAGNAPPDDIPASASGQPNDPAAATTDLPRVGSPLLHQATRCRSCGRTGPPQIPISVTASLEALLGLSAEPAELDGWGLLDPDTARDLAADGAWRRWLCEPTSGHLLDVGATTYRPSTSLARFVRARDRTCRWPNCHQPPIRCDLDHTEPFDTGGPTTRANLSCLCRRHHRIKHHTDATYHQQPDGTTTWTTPDGHTHTRPADRHHHETDWPDWHHEPPGCQVATEPAMSEPDTPVREECPV